MKSNNQKTSGRSLVLSVLIIVAIGTTALSALYVGGLVGHSENQKQTTTSSQTAVPPGGYMLVRNSTLTTCLPTTTTTTNESSSSTTSTSSTISCVPMGVG